MKCQHMFAISNIYVHIYWNPAV